MRKRPRPRTRIKKLTFGRWQYELPDNKNGLRTEIAALERQLEEAERIEYVKVTCSECGGDGNSDSHLSPCQTCYGKGTETVKRITNPEYEAEFTRLRAEKSKEYDRGYSDGLNDAIPDDVRHENETLRAENERLEQAVSEANADYDTALNILSGINKAVGAGSAAPWTPDRIESLRSRLATTEPVRVSDRAPELEDASMDGAEVEVWLRDYRDDVPYWVRVPIEDYNEWVDDITHWRRIDSTPPTTNPKSISRKLDITPPEEEAK